MSNLVDINQLREEFVQKTKTKDLKAFAEQQQVVIEKLVNQNRQLQEKNDHLEKILMSLEKNNMVISVSPEEMICVEQIEVLKSKSATRELQLDEVKRLDLLVKNLRLIREQSTQVIESTNHSHIKEMDLVAIATQADPE